MMKMMKRVFGLLWIFIFLWHAGHCQETRPDSIKALYNARLNYVQYYNKEALQSFSSKWNGGGRIVIAHFGDSHVQPGIYPGELRRQLQYAKGQAGFGMVFPYSIAKTYSAIDYFTSHTGAWQFAKSLEFRPKLPLGVSGVTVRTIDSRASFRIKFKKPISQDNTRIRIFCRQDRKSFDLKISNGSEEILVDIDSGKVRPLEVVLNRMDSVLDFRLVKQWSYQNEFEFYGLSIENESPRGVLLHALGVGGSRYGSLLEEKLFDMQMPWLKADLVILDFGTNDFLYDNAIPLLMEEQIVQVITKVRTAAPEATVMLTTTQDMNRKGMNIDAAEGFADLIRKIARNQKCPFYDWYWISGGPERMEAWMENGLSQKDMIHLTLKGATLKGQLLSEALTKSISLSGRTKGYDSLVFNVDSLKALAHAVPDTVQLDTATIKIEPVVVKQVNFVRHKIVKGETLRSIARLYKVKVDDLKKANGLQNSVIIEGDYLNVEIPETEIIDKIIAKAEKGKSGKAPKGKYLIHKVAPGDTLSEIAEKYHVGVKQIQKLNGLKNTKIRIGQSLKIKLITESSKGR